MVNQVQPQGEKDMAAESVRLFGAELMSPEDVAEALGISPATIRRWLRDKAIAGVKVGRQWRVNITVVREQLASGELAREIEPQGYKALDAAVDILNAADAADRHEAIRYLLNALRSKLPDDGAMAALLMAWQQDIGERLESLGGADTRRYSQARRNFISQNGENDILAWSDENVDPVSQGRPGGDRTEGV
jgi:excisionase family DNA binding protein